MLTPRKKSRLPGKQFFPEEDGTHNAESSRTASPTHCQLSYYVSLIVHKVHTKIEGMGEMVWTCCAARTVSGRTMSISFRESKLLTNTLTTTWQISSVTQGQQETH